MQAMFESRVEGVILASGTGDITRSQGAINGEVACRDVGSAGAVGREEEEAWIAGEAGGC